MWKTTLLCSHAISFRCVLVNKNTHWHLLMKHKTFSTIKYYLIFCWVRWQPTCLEVWTNTQGTQKTKILSLTIVTLRFLCVSTSFLQNQWMIVLFYKYFIRFKMSVVLVKKIVLKLMSLSVFNAIINFSFQLYPSINIIYTTFKILFFLERKTNQ